MNSKRVGARLRETSFFSAKQLPVIDDNKVLIGQLRSNATRMAAELLGGPAKKELVKTKSGDVLCWMKQTSVL
jgi:hypothetical protein